MTRYIHNIIFLAVLITTTASCSRAYRFVGTVVDGQGIGVGDAKIVVCPTDEPKSTKEQMSNSDGTFEASWCCTPGVKFFQIVTSKQGYDDDSRIVVADQKDIRIVLSRSTKASK